MKLSIAFLHLFTTVTLAQTHGDDSCTRGRLFLSDGASTMIHAFELDDLASLSTPFYSFTASGKAGINLQTSSSNKDVATIFRGMAADGFKDGVVEFYNAGIAADSHGDHFDITRTNPYLVNNTRFSCARPIHYVVHDEKIAFFCDGSFEEPQVNSTVWVLDETLFGSTDKSAIVFNTTLEGSHHGVAVPVDDDHVMYSLPLADRVNRVPDSSSLPATFLVIDYSGNTLHSLTNESDPDTSCMGFHGSAAKNGLFALACDESHGGILLVEYDQSSSAYSSRALAYPDEFPEHRTGSFSEHPEAEYIIGNFDGPNDSFNLMAFKHQDSRLSQGNVLTLPEEACSYALEKSNGEVVVALLASGMVHAFQFEDDQWVELASLQVVSNMPNCTGAMLIPGFVSAFVVYQPTQTVYALNLEHVYEGDIESSSSKLSFTPFDGVVAGAPSEVACLMEHEHDHGEGDGSSAAYAISMFTAMVLCIVSAIMAHQTTIM